MSASARPLLLSASPPAAAAEFRFRPRRVITREQVVTIAQQFVQTRLPEGSVRLDSPFARRKAVGERFRWSIMFDRITPPDVVVSPGEIIVLVDEATGTPEFEPVP